MDARGRDELLVSERVLALQDQGDPGDLPDLRGQLNRSKSKGLRYGCQHEGSHVLKTHEPRTDPRFERVEMSFQALVDERIERKRLSLFHQVVEAVPLVGVVGVHEVPDGHNIRSRCVLLVEAIHERLIRSQRQCNVASSGVSSIGFVDLKYLQSLLEALQSPWPVVCAQVELP